MANGFFLGGAASGISDANKMALAEQTQEQEVGLRTRALDLQEKSLKDAGDRSIVARVDKQISDTMSIVSETVKAGLEGGSDPAKIRAAVAPLIDSAKSLAARAGRDPASIEAQANAAFALPSPTQAAIAKGTAKGFGDAAAKIAEQKALGAAGIDGTGGWKDLNQKTTAENSLRDDYLKQSADFIKIRDAKNRIDAIEGTGAGDVALVFQFMKILDPGSTVREGEFATASNAAGVPAAITGLYNKLRGGGILAEKARNDIVKQANSLYQAQSSQQDKLTNQFANIAKRQKLSIDNVIVELNPPEPAFGDRFSGTTPSGLKYRLKQ